MSETKEAVAEKPAPEKAEVEATKKEQSTREKVVKLPPLCVKLRKKRGAKSMQSVANQIGCSVQFYNNVEKGRRRPSMEALTKWIKVTGLVAGDFYPEAKGLFR